MRPPLLREGSWQAAADADAAAAAATPSAADSQADIAASAVDGVRRRLAGGGTVAANVYSSGNYQLEATLGMLGTSQLSLAGGGGSVRRSGELTRAASDGGAVLRERARRAFMAFDSDGDGRLSSVADIACALHAMGFRHRLDLLASVARSVLPGGGGGDYSEGFDLPLFEAAARRVHELETLGLRDMEGPHSTGVVAMY